MPHGDQTTVIQGWVERLGQGDDSAREALGSVPQRYEMSHSELST
jgi:hypothetical protein